MGWTEIYILCRRYVWYIHVIDMQSGLSGALDAAGYALLLDLASIHDNE